MGQGYFSALIKQRKNRGCNRAKPCKYSIHYLMGLKDNIMNDLDNSICLDMPKNKKESKKDDEIIIIKEDDKMVMNNTCRIVNRSRCCEICNTIKDENNFMIKSVICNKCLIQKTKENNEAK